MNTLHIRQDSPKRGKYPVRLTLVKPGQANQEAEAKIAFALTSQEQDDIRWYLEDYLQRADVTEAVIAEQIQERMKTRGEELYTKVFTANPNTQALWFSIRNDLADLRVEIATGVVEAASIPWELMRDPQSNSPIATRVKAFVRVQSQSNISFVSTPPMQENRIRLLYIACRPGGSRDVELRAVANRLLQDLGGDRARFDITALRPPTFERLQQELADAKAAGRPYHIVHFDGHGIYADLSQSKLADWLGVFSPHMLGAGRAGKHGYLLFEHPGDDKIRPVDGQMLGQLLHDNGVPVLVLNACQSAMHTATTAPETTGDVHAEVQAIGSLAQAVVEQGIPAVLGMRYSVYVVTAAQYIGQLYSALAKGRSFGEAATEGRKYLHLNPDRWIGLKARPLQDWFVPVIYEARSMELCSATPVSVLSEQPDLDPLQGNPVLLRYVPEEGFIGRDETLLALDRAFDGHRVVLLQAYAGQGKSSAAVEFARWYSLTGGLGKQPLVLLASFERPVDLADLLNQIGQQASIASWLLSQGKDWSAINDLDTRRQIVFQILRQFPILWIWDNVEPIAGFPDGTDSQWTAAEQSELRAFLQQIKLDTASQVKILLTSRRDETKWLGGIPYRIAMPRMRNSDAAKLALKLGEDRGLKRSEIADWQPLLDYCDGNPLTLRVLVGQAIRAGVRGKERVAEFVEAIRSGEQQIEDTDEAQGRDKSLGAALSYGFRHAFQAEELPIIALIHLFHGTVDVNVLLYMGNIGVYALPELAGRSQEDLTDLLERAQEIGLLTHLGATWFRIHPALPWFLHQLFARHFDGLEARSSSLSALGAWVEAIGELGNYYHEKFNAGNQRVIQFLELEESNLLQARRLARHNQWWGRVISCMQGLDALYEYQGRTAEWARLVKEIRPDYCTDEDEPITGREDDYSLVMGYRVHLAREYERDLSRGAALQKKRVALNRQQAATILALSSDAPLDVEQCHRLRILSMDVGTLGQILQDQGSAECVPYFLETIRYFQRLGDEQSEAISEYNLGHAYKDIITIRDLDAAEASYKRSLNLYSPNNVLYRSRCISQIGMVHHERFRNAQQCNEHADILLRHARAAETCYLEALQLCPEDTPNDLATRHNVLGCLYVDFGQFDKAREHYELSVQYKERVGNYFGAGNPRYNMAIMYFQAAMGEAQLSQQRSSLLRARAYAEAALRDYRHYQGRAVNEEANAQALLYDIDKALA